MFQSAPEDFGLGEARNIETETVLSDPSWTLYCLDHEKREALFVKTPHNLDLTQAPFLFQAQFLNAQELITIDFETFHRLAATIKPDSQKIIFVHSVGRCGSTLMSKVFSSLPGVCSLSEPDPATQLTEWRGRHLLPERELYALSESSTRFSCKPWPARNHDTRWAFKYRAQCIEIADWLMKAFPNAKQLFIRRQPLSWLESAFRAFVEPEQYRDPAFIALFEEVWGHYLPLIQNQQTPGKPMSVSKTWMYIWIAVRESQKHHESAGLHFHELDYEQLKTNPEHILKKAFEYCGLTTDDWSPVHATLQEDSQAGTVIARSKIRNLDRAVPQDGLAEAISLLTQWGYPPAPIQ